MERWSDALVDHLPEIIIMYKIAISTPRIPKKQLSRSAGGVKRHGALGRASYAG